MAHQSLYRRYRPQRFSEVRGQANVVGALRSAVADERVGHAYLFSGPRGTGKTSTARILAKALNCTDLRDGEPCCVCASCETMQAGTSYDLQELDAASNNKVEDVRELIERVALGSPGRTKVYILDEVHMLSAGASNALLKTLEEPPDHVVFVLATTDPQKVLPTIRSRTQHFEFHLLPADELADHVRWVIGDAGLDVDEAAVEHVLRAGGGSARDTLSFLDQAAAGGVGGDSEHAEALAESIVAVDTAAALTAVANATIAGRDPRVLGEGLLAHLRDIFLQRMGGPLAHLSDAARARVDDWAGRVTDRGVTTALEEVGEALLAMRQAPDARIPLEVALVRLTSGSGGGGGSAAGGSGASSADLAPLLARIERLEAAIASGAGSTPVTRAPSDPAPATGSSSSPRPDDAPSRRDDRSTPPSAASDSGHEPSGGGGSTAGGGGVMSARDAARAAARGASGVKKEAPRPADRPSEAPPTRPGASEARTDPPPTSPRQQQEQPAADPPPAEAPPSSPRAEPDHTGETSAQDEPATPNRAAPDHQGAELQAADHQAPDLGEAPAEPADIAGGAPHEIADTSSDAVVAPAVVAAAPAVDGGAALATMWSERVVPDELRGMAKALYKLGQVVATTDDSITVGLPNQTHLERCTEKRDEVEGALTRVVGRPIRLNLVVGGDDPSDDDGRSTPSARGPRPAEHESIDMDDLVDAPSQTVSGVDRVTEAFPGAKIVDS